MPCSSTRHGQAGLMILMSLFSILAPWNPGTYQTKLKWALETWATKSLAEKTQRATARAADIEILISSPKIQHLKKLGS